MSQVIYRLVLGSHLHPTNQKTILKIYSKSDAGDFVTPETFNLRLVKSAANDQTDHSMKNDMWQHLQFFQCFSNLWVSHWIPDQILVWIPVKYFKAVGTSCL